MTPLALRCSDCCATREPRYTVQQVLLHYIMVHSRRILSAFPRCKVQDYYVSEAFTHPAVRSTHQKRPPQHLQDCEVGYVSHTRHTSPHHSTAPNDVNGQEEEWYFHHEGAAKMTPFTLSHATSSTRQVQWDAGSERDQSHHQRVWVRTLDSPQPAEKKRTHGGKLRSPHTLPLPGTQEAANSFPSRARGNPEREREAAYINQMYL